jgi:hypothetical protein
VRAYIKIKQAGKILTAATALWVLGFLCSQLHSTSESDFTSFLDAVLLHALVAAEIITQSSCSQNTHAFAQQNTPVHRARLLSTFQQKIFSKGE